VAGRGEVDGAASIGAVGAQKGDGQEERQHSAIERSDHENAPKTLVPQQVSQALSLSRRKGIKHGVVTPCKRRDECYSKAYHEKS